MTYTVFIWNKRLAQTQYDIDTGKIQKSDSFSKNWYKHTNLEPVVFNNVTVYKHPIIAIGNKVHKMITVEEYMRRI